MTPVFWRSDTAMVWLFVAIASLWFGFLCFIPSQTMVIILYRHALEVMPQQAWGALLLVHGVLSVIYVIFDKKRLCAICISSLGLVVWFLLVGALMTTLHSWMPIGGEIAVCLACVYLFIRALTDG